MNKVCLTEKQAKLIKEVLWMGTLWARSLIDCHVENGPSDLKTAIRAMKLINKKIKSNE